MGPSCRIFCNINLYLIPTNVSCEYCITLPGMTANITNTFFSFCMHVIVVYAYHRLHAFPSQACSLLSYPPQRRFPQTCFITLNVWATLTLRHWDKHPAAGECKSECGLDCLVYIRTKRCNFRSRGLRTICRHDGCYGTHVHLLS